jgi:hypothetical protein
MRHENASGIRGETDQSRRDDGIKPRVTEGNPGMRGPAHAEPPEGAAESFERAAFRIRGTVRRAFI